LARIGFLGGSSHELAAGIQVDPAGNAYVVGTTQSPDFPTTPGAFKRTGATSNFSDVSNFDWGRGIAIDAAGNACVTGQTKSSRSWTR